SAPTSPPAPSSGSPVPEPRGSDERDLRGSPADRGDGDAGRRGGVRGDRSRRAPGRDHHGLEKRQAQDAAGRGGAPRRRHPLRGAGDERPSRSRARSRVLHQRPDAGTEGDHRRRRDVGGPARRRRRPHRPAGGRGADPRQEPRRSRRPPLRGPDAPRRPGRLRRRRRREKRRIAGGPHNQRVIARYTRPEIGEVWSQQRKLECWLEVELAATEAWAEEGVVPKEAAEACRAKASFTVEAVNELEKVTDHDVAAFVDVDAEAEGEAGDWA